MRRCVLLVVLLGAAPAGADRDRFQASWEAGQDAFNLGKYAEARRHFRRARELKPELPGPHRWLGRVSRVLEDWEDCVASATTAVRLKPASPQTAEVKKDLDACRSALGRPEYGRPLREGQGALAVIADVDGAAVTVDGIAKGPTPLEPVPLNGGRHVLRVAADGHAPLSIDVEIVPGITVDAIVKLQRQAP
jgi:tetratricopeptide (TPR) repeat protein